MTECDRPRDEGPIRLVVVDDHTLFRRGIIALLSQEPGFAVVGEAADGFEGIRTVLAQKSDVVLLDLNMPGISALEALAAILKDPPGTHIVMLTVSEDADDLVRALRNGALGYLLKNIDGEFLVRSIRRACKPRPHPYSLPPSPPLPPFVPILVPILVPAWGWFNIVILKLKRSSCG